MKNNKWKKVTYCLLVIGVVGGLVIGGCAPKPAAPPAPAPKPPAPLLPYKIGITISQTGAFGGIGKAQFTGFEPYIKELNRKGGIDGHPVELVIFDDESDETKTVTLARRVTEADKVHILWGATHTGPVMALKPLTDELEVVTLGTSGSTAVDVPVKKWFFRPLATERNECRSLFKGLKAAGVTKIAVLLQGAGYGLGSWDVIKDEIDKHGFELVIKETYDPKGLDFTPQLAKIKASPANGLLVFGAEMAGGLAVKQARELGIKWPIGFPAPMGTPDIVKALIKTFETPDTYHSDYAVTVLPELPADYPYLPVLKAANELIMKEYGRPVIMWDVVGIHTGMIIEEVLKRTKPDPDPAKIKEARAKIRDAMETLKDFRTGLGTYTVTPTDHCGAVFEARACVTFKEGRKVLFKLL